MHSIRKMQDDYPDNRWEVVYRSPQSITNVAVVDDYLSKDNAIELCNRLNGGVDIKTITEGLTEGILGGFFKLSREEFDIAKKQ